MIIYRSGDILQDDAQALVNPVNCVGTMGKGLAKAFKNAFPANDRAYRDRCRRQLLRPGRIFIFTLQGTPNRYILNFPTKDHWRDPSTIEYIDKGLKTLAAAVTSRHITSISIPALGTGLGGLEWETVHQLLLHHMEPLTSTEVRIFTPRHNRHRRHQGVTR